MENPKLFSVACSSAACLSSLTKPSQGPTWTSQAAIFDYGSLLCNLPLVKIVLLHHLGSYPSSRLLLDCPLAPSWKWLLQVTAEGSRGTTCSCWLCGNHSSQHAVPAAESFWGGAHKSKMNHCKVTNIKRKVTKWKTMENQSVVWVLRKALLPFVKMHVLQVWKYQFQHGILCLVPNLIGCTLLVYFGLHLYLIFSGPFYCIWVGWHAVTYVHAVRLSYPPVSDCI